MWGVVYGLLLAALVLRFRPGDAPRPEPVHPRPGEPLWLTRLHHALFTLILLGVPVEILLVGGAGAGRMAGAVLFGTGVILYRLAGQALGEALSPFIEPREAAGLVTAGPYGYLRHPMYLSEALIAVGAPLTLGSRHLIALVAPAVLVLGVRVIREEEALARTFPEYFRYAARTKRIVPFVY
jgi:protein-S-isoprenylcysteine O-methyltransferase Ste14